MPRPPRAKVALSTTRVTKPKPAPRKQNAKTTPTQRRKAAEIVNSFSDDSDGLVTQSIRPRRGIRSDDTTDPALGAEFTMTGALPAEEDNSIPSIKNRTPVTKPSKKMRTTKEVQRSTKTSSPAVIPPQVPSPLADARGDIPHDEEDTSGFGDLTFSSLGSDSPAHGTRPPSAIKVGATPAHERSILALTNFKRRARQPSLLRMMQQTTDVEDNDQDDLDNTDNFNFGDLDDYASPVVQVPRSSPPFSPPSGADVESTRSHSPSLPDVLSSREAIVEQTQDDPELMSETYAPPQSSSPVREVSTPPPSAAPTARPRRGRAAKTYSRDDESEAEAEETETPTKHRRGARKRTQPTISTAQLTDLLPRRRRILHNYDEFDLDFSDDVQQVDSDQDELQMPERRNRQRPGTGKPTSPKATKKSTRGRKGASAKTGHRVSKTYSRRISSDKENDRANRDEEGTAEISAIEQSEKLAAIRKKFEEVDAFELEFETVDATTSSSPFR